MSDLLGGWLKIKLSDIAELIMGQSPPSSTYNTRGQGLPFFQGKAEFGDFYPIAIKYCSSPIKIAEVGDVLISVRAPVGPTNLCKEKSCIGRGLAALRPSSGITTKYLFYYLRNIEDWLSTQGTGSTFTAITKEDLENIEVILPPLNEQRRIVAKLENLLGKVDACKERLEKIPTILKRFRQSVLSAACSGRLTADWREKNPDVEPAEELLKRIEKEWSKKGRNISEDIQMQIEKDGLPKLPEKWKYVLLSQVSTIIMGQSPPGESYNLEGHGMPLINGPVEFGEKAFSSIIKSKFTTKVTKTCEENDLLICVRGSTTGRTNIAGFKACIGRGVAAIRAQSVEQWYLNYYLHSKYEEILSSGTGSTFPNISSEYLESIITPLPPLPEQQEIVRRVEALFKIADQIEERYKKARGYVDKLTQSILAKAFRGELVPQDPNDEPASVLLERIREERNRRRDKSQTGKTKNHRRQRRQNQLRMDI
jgi:type I restriction enzyme S subunit